VTLFDPPSEKAPDVDNSPFTSKLGRFSTLAGMIVFGLFTFGICNIFFGGAQSLAEGIGLVVVTAPIIALTVNQWAHHAPVGFAIAAYAILGGGRRGHAVYLPQWHIRLDYALYFSMSAVICHLVTRTRLRTLDRVSLFGGAFSFAYSLAFESATEPPPHGGGPIANLTVSFALMALGPAMLFASWTYEWAHRQTMPEVKSWRHEEMSRAEATGIAARHRDNQ
jgi:hypothetical protein